MNAPRRVLAAALAALAVSFGATACDSSPVAAQVGSVTIKQTALNAELRGWAGSPRYVAAIAQQNTSAGVTVHGDGTGTYNATWVAGILSEMIAAAAVHQHLADTGRLPGSAVLAAARSVDQIDYGPVWPQLPTDLQDRLVQRAADEAVLSSPKVDGTILSAAYQQYKQYFFFQVCVEVTTFTTLEQAQEFSYSGQTHGATQCFTQSQLESRPSSFAATVRGLRAGESSKPTRTANGLYQVISVTHRVNQGYTKAVRRVLAAAVTAAQNNGEDAAVGAVVRHVKVSVNPEYGTWKAPQVVPPKAPTAGS